jgi:hypothetical protein
MVTRNRSRKTSIDIDNEAIPVLVANDDLNAEQTSSFLRAESKDDKDAESDVDVDLDVDIDGDLDDEWDDYVNVVADTEDDGCHVCNEMVAVTSPYIREMVEKGRCCVQYIYSASSVYLFWIMVHYFSAQLYVYYCAPRGLYGFLISPFLVAAPHCRAIRWIIHNGGNMVDNMWLILGTWLCSKVMTGS